MGKIYTFETGKTAENEKEFQASYVTHRENRVEYGRRIIFRMDWG